MTLFEKHFLIFSALFISLLIILAIPLVVNGQTPSQRSYNRSGYEKIIWLDNLAICESGNHDWAINPKDLDGTMSLGRYQFKVKTYLWLIDKYDIPMSPIFDGKTQRQIVSRMIDDPDINLKMQFPDCVRRLGLPI